MSPVPTLARLALAAGALLTVACGSPAPTARAAATPESVIAHLKAAGLPISKPVIYTAETDTNKLLGRPNQYTAKANWHDDRAPDGDDGTTVEIFATDADRKTRQDYVAAIAKTPIFAEYAYSRGLVLLRVSGKLTPDQAAEYERALQTLS